MSNIIYKKENGNFSFASNNLRVTFSNPQIQPNDEYGYVQNEKNIRYFYYTVKCERKIGEKWTKAFTVETYDFPSIIQFKRILHHFITNEPRLEYYQKMDTDNFGSFHTYTVNTSRMGEDNYLVMHDVVVKDNKITKSIFSVSVNMTYSLCSDEMMGLSFGNLLLDDIKTIFQCVSDFIQYSIDKENVIIKKRNETNMKSWVITNGKLYKYSEDGETIEEIFTVGDRVDEMLILNGDLKTTDYYSSSYCNCIIADIKRNGIYIANGYVENGKTGDITSIENKIFVPIKMLIDVFKEINDEKLFYSEDEIAKDFLGILSEKEKNEFLMASNKILFSKWSKAIMNRTCMCREEHNLPKRVSDEGNHENVYESIKHIIQTIKQNIDQ